jgi:DNA invertase Pin-like site-specific DNA recombinase
MRKFTKPDLPREHERRFWQGIRAGLSVDEAAVSAGASWSWARRLFVKAGGVNPTTSAEPIGRRYLRFEEREEIMRLQASGLGVRAIAREIGRHPSTVSRELKRAVGVRGPRSRDDQPP